MGSKLHLKDAVAMFGINHKELLLQKLHELEELDAVMGRFAALYATTVSALWADGLHGASIDVENLWISSPLHQERKHLQSYVYEIMALADPSRLSEHDIKRAKEYPIQNILPEKGKRGYYRCPFHSEKTPSFKLYKNNTYHCFGCSKHGDSIALVMELHKLPFTRAVRYLLNHE